MASETERQGNPSTPVSLGFTGSTVQPQSRKARTALFPNLVRFDEAPRMATVGTWRG